jgi:Flp pilus assembly protein TadB
VSGSFYLLALVAILALLLVAGAVLPVWALPVVVIGGLLGVAVIGALQLRQDERLSQKNFMELMVMTLARLPLLLKGRKP